MKPSCTKYIKTKFNPLTYLRVPILLNLILSLLFSPSLSFAQSTTVLDKKISISIDDQTIANVLKVIGTEAGCKFSYSNSTIKDQKRVSVNYNQLAVSEILQKLLGNEVKLQISGNQVFIRLGDGKGNIKGTVKTSDGKPAEFVTIGIKGQKGTQVDANGNYTLKGVESGDHILTASYVGLNTQSQKVNIDANETAVVNFILTENKQQLNEVVVNGNKPNKFANKESENIARLPIKNLENPQVYNVVSQAIMKEQVMTSYAEAFQNVAGISTSNILNTRGTSFFLRGFSSPPSMRNGLAAPPFTESIEPVNIERVEVLKGPSATLFGSSQTSFGGAVNNVTKKPFDHVGGEISYNLGSWNLSRMTVDYNTPLNKDTTLMFRINAARHWANTFQDYGYQHNYAVAPSLLYKVNPRLTLQLDAEINSYKGTMWSYASFGPDVTIKNIKDLKIPYNRSVAGNQLLQEWTSSSVYAKADYKISDQWTSSTNVIQSIYNRSELYGMNDNVWINDSTLVRAIFGAKPQEMSAYQIQQNFNGDFKLGKMRNRMVIGLDAYLSKSNSTFLNGPDSVLDSYHYHDTFIMNGPQNPVNVSKETILAFLGAGKPNNYISSTNTYSIYASDVINVTDRLLAMLSLRLDYFDNKNQVTNGVKATEGAYSQTALSPKLGLVYQVVKDKVSIFGNYMNGFTNNAPGTDKENKPINYKPSQANQWETGVKAEILQNKLSFNLSYYNIGVKNALRYDVNPATQDGTQYSRGFEAEIIAEPLPGLNVTAGYGYNKSKYEKADETLDGKSLGAPENVANFWISYKLPEGKVKGLGLGFGGNYVSEVTINHPIVIPSYTLFNAVVFYDQPRYRIGFKLNNISNEKYWSWDFISPQPPRNYVLNVSYKF